MQVADDVWIVGHGRCELCGFTAGHARPRQGRATRRAAVAGVGRPDWARDPEWGAAAYLHSSRVCRPTAHASPLVIRDDKATFTSSISNGRRS